MMCGIVNCMPVCSLFHVRRPNGVPQSSYARDVHPANNGVLLVRTRPCKKLATSTLSCRLGLVLGPPANLVASRDGLREAYLIASRDGLSN